MGHDEEPRTGQEQNGARTGAASTGTNEDMLLAGSDAGPSQTADDARIDGPSRATRSEAAPSGAASSPTKPTEAPALNKWQSSKWQSNKWQSNKWQSNKWEKFWRGVLHVDTAKMDPWTAARNAIGVALPLAVGIAVGMPLGGLAVASGAL